jgi:hypothetical protein
MNTSAGCGDDRAPICVAWSVVGTTRWAFGKSCSHCCPGGNVASAQAREAERALNQYLPYAGEPVDRFWGTAALKLVGDLRWWYGRDSMKPVADRRWACNDLEWKDAISVTSTVHVVSRRFDSVVVGHDKCRINEIRPIDYKKYLADRKQAREAAKS